MILLADPVVGCLNDLPGPARGRFLADMVALGDALLAVTDACRINYQILGNLDPVLHAHVCPRYAWEPEALRKGPTAFYDKNAGPGFDPRRHREMMDRIGGWLDQNHERERLPR